MTKTFYYNHYKLFYNAIHFCVFLLLIVLHLQLHFLNGNLDIREVYF